MEVVTLTKELNDHQFCVLPAMMLYLLDKWSKGGNPVEDLEKYGIDKEFAKSGINILVTRDLIHPVVSSNTFGQGVVIENITESRPGDFKNQSILTRKGVSFLADYTNIQDMLGRWVVWQL